MSSNSTDFFQEVIYQYASPPVAVFGILGNLVNIKVLGSKIYQRKTKMTDRAALFCVKTLSISDLIVCSLILTQVFVFTLECSTASFGEQVRCLFNLYAPVLINVFMFFSTWITVLLSLDRYLIVNSSRLPKWKKAFCNRIKPICLTVFLINCLLNVPIIWRFKKEPTADPDKSILKIDDHSIHIQLHRWMSAIALNLIPPILMGISNTYQIIKIRKATKIRKASVKERETEQQTTFNFRARASTYTSTSYSPLNHITITLVVVVLMFILLVTPSDILACIAILGNTSHIPSYKKAETFFNLTQLINYSINFLIYASMNKTFRTCLHTIFTNCAESCRASDDEEESYEIVTNKARKKNNGNENEMKPLNN